MVVGRSSLDRLLTVDLHVWRYGVNSLNDVILGAYFHITKPMGDTRVRSVLKWIRSYSYVTSALAYVCFGMFLYTSDSNTQSFAKDVVQSMIAPRAILSLLVSALSKYLYTTLTGFDYIINEIAGQRKYERELAEKPSLIASLFSQRQQAQTLNDLSENRNYRLDELSKMSDGLVGRQ